MKKIFQRIVDPIHGDCFKAALASILELQYDEMPAFDPSVENSVIDFYAFLAEKNIYVSKILWNPNISNDMLVSQSFLNIKELTSVSNLFSATVASPLYHDPTKTAYENVMSGKGHSVVCNSNFDILFDPNPKNAGIQYYPFADIIGYNGIVYIREIRRKHEIS